MFNSFAAYGNIALGKNTKQSSTIPGSNGYPDCCGSEKAVDGYVGSYNHNYNWNWKWSSAHTNLELNTWWWVDLGCNYSVTSVIIYNTQNNVRRYPIFEVVVERLIILILARR